MKKYNGIHFKNQVICDICFENFWLVNGKCYQYRKRPICEDCATTEINELIEGVLEHRRKLLKINIEKLKKRRNTGKLFICFNETEADFPEIYGTENNNSKTVKK